MNIYKRTNKIFRMIISQWLIISVMRNIYVIIYEYPLPIFIYWLKTDIFYT